MSEEKKRMICEKVLELAKKGVGTKPNRRSAFCFSKRA